MPSWFTTPIAFLFFTTMGKKEFQLNGKGDAKGENQKQPGFNGKTGDHDIVSLPDSLQR
jgi:hypothetical protein